MAQTDDGSNDLVPDLVVAVFRLNGTLVETGNELVGQLGLTTAWWQVLGALFRSPTPLPVAHIARNMGLSRQSVQRNVDLLAGRGMVRFAPNPHHQRAKLVVLTAAGSTAMKAADARQQPLGRRWRCWAKWTRCCPGPQAAARTWRRKASRHRKSRIT